MSEDRLLTDADVAALIGTSRRWVEEAAKRGEIPHLKFGQRRRYRRESIDAWLAEIETLTARQMTGSPHCSGLVVRFRGSVLAARRGRAPAPELVEIHTRSPTGDLDETRTPLLGDARLVAVEARLWGSVPEPDGYKNRVQTSGSRRQRGQR